MQQKQTIQSWCSLSTNNQKQAKKEQKRLKEEQKLQSKLEVKAMPYNEDDSNINEISNKKESHLNSIKNAVFKKKSKELEYSELIRIEIDKKKKKNDLIGDFELEQPELRDYN